MKRWNIPIVLTLLFLPVLRQPASAADAGDADTEMRQLRRQLLAMQRQMLEMQKRHDREIRELKKELQALRQGRTVPASTEEEEAARLRRLARSEAAVEETATASSGETVFKAGNLSLQRLNPELSVVGDMVGLVRGQAGVRERSDFNFRCLGLHFASYLDPYSRFKGAVELHQGDEPAELGEAYMTRYGVLPNVNLTLGKFRQQFGVVNRWHKHGLDQVDFPLALREIFGEDGLNQTGLSLDWSMPMLWGASQALTIQLTDGENGRLFGGNTLNSPCVLIHYKNYRDLSKDTYCEVGLSGLLGWNDEWTVNGIGRHDRLGTRVFGLDLNLLWEPTDRMRYRNIEWRSEFYWLNRDILAPDGSGRDTLNAWGAYTYLQSKLDRNWDVGLRLDYYRPDGKSYADASLEPLAFASDGPYRWQVGPYILWRQSPFVRYRLEYNRIDGHGMDAAEDLLMFQLIFAAGPHKHERY